MILTGWCNIFSETSTVQASIKYLDTGQGKERDHDECEDAQVQQRNTGHG